ncbi:MAG: aminoglycoside phosphotransferase family protein [Pseudomonadota bacterium]
MELEQRCKALAAELNLANPNNVKEVVPLTGGVASDIAVVDLGTRRICMKFALPKLKVDAIWQAPVHRSAAEYAWLEVAAKVIPESAIRLFGYSATFHGFAAEFIEGKDVYLWKDNLLREAPAQNEAAFVAACLGRIHGASAQTSFNSTPFRNRDDFHALRIEPYLVHTRKAHPTLHDQIAPMETMLYEADRILVHGDVSPKNILFRKGGPILLDAECATMGDACFDPSFCLNHLVLKAIHLPTSRERLLADVTAFWQAYAAHVTWEDLPALEARVCALLPVLMLARVDGKSPVEYLSESERQTVREVAFPLIAAPVTRIEAFTNRLSQHLVEGAHD